MKQSWINNSWMLPLVFSLYETLLMWFFGFPEFVPAGIPLWQLLLGLLGALLVVFRGFDLILKKSIQGNAMRNVWTLMSTTVVVAVTGWFVLRMEAEYALSYFSGFLLSTVVFAVFHYLLVVLRGIPTGLSLNINETGEKTAKAVLAIEQKGRAKMELPLDTIICFEANDNYVTIHYLNAEGKPVKRLERLSMRKVEELLTDSEAVFLRVHKSFLINRHFVLEVTGKSQAYRIRLAHLEEQIPVSRNVKIRELLPNH